MEGLLEVIRFLWLSQMISEELEHTALVTYISSEDVASKWNLCKWKISQARSELRTYNLVNISVAWPVCAQNTSTSLQLSKTSYTRASLWYGAEDHMILIYLLSWTTVSSVSPDSLPKDFFFYLFHLKQSLAALAKAFHSVGNSRLKTQPLKNLFCCFPFEKNVLLLFFFKPRMK